MVISGRTEEVVGGGGGWRGKTATRFLYVCMCALSVCLASCVVCNFCKIVCWCIHVCHVSLCERYFVCVALFVICRGGSSRVANHIAGLACGCVCFDCIRVHIQYSVAVVQFLATNRMYQVVE